MESTISLLVRIAPFAIASAFSGSLLAATLIILTGKGNSKMRALTFSLGIATANIFVIIVSYFLTNLIFSAVEHTPETVSAVIDVVLGALLVFIAVIIALSKPKKKPKKKRQISAEQTSARLIRYFLVGFAAMITNLTSIPLVIVVVKETVDSNVEILGQVVVLLFTLLMVMMPVLLPWLLYSISPKYARKILEPVNRIIKKYGKRVMYIVFFILGAFLIIRGSVELIIGKRIAYKMMSSTKIPWILIYNLLSAF